MTRVAIIGAALADQLTIQGSEVVVIDAAALQPAPEWDYLTSGRHKTSSGGGPPQYSRSSQRSHAAPSGPAWFSASSAPMSGTRR